MDTTTKLGIPYMEGTDLGASIDETDQAKAEWMDTNLGTYAQGSLASRPTSTVGSPGKSGRRYYATDAQVEYLDYGTGWIAIGADTADIKATARAAAPVGWLLCDGAAVSRTTYKPLFDTIGTAYGAGDGSTTFNLPDLRGRTPVGVDGAAARLSANDALGKSAGAEKQTLATTEIPAHTHGVTDPGHEHGLRLNSAADPNPGVNYSPGTGNAIRDASQGFPLVAAGSTGISIQSQGGGQAHNNMPPYQIVNYIVKT